MIRINLQEIAKKKEEAKNAPQPKIKIRVVSQQTVDGPQSTALPIAKFNEPLTESHFKEASKKVLLLHLKAWDDFNQLKLERSKLSNTIQEKIDAGATPGELKDLYDRIESYQPELERLHDIARHVDQYGTLPEEKKVDNQPVDIFSLKDQRKKLIDKRCKLQKKIEVGSAKNPTRLTQWQVDLDEANAEYKLIDEKIKKLEGKL